MLFPFLVMFREGVEAALSVGIIASYLRQTGRTHLMKAIWIGIGLATLMCLCVAIILQLPSQDSPQQEQELFAAVILTWMVFWMRHAARSIKGELQSQIETAIQSGIKPLSGGYFFVLPGLNTTEHYLEPLVEGMATQSVTTPTS